jgi:hypothetical protein
VYNIYITFYDKEEIPLKLETFLHLNIAQFSSHLKESKQNKLFPKQPSMAMCPTDDGFD